jgi:aconitase B
VKFGELAAAADWQPHGDKNAVMVVAVPLTMTKQALKDVFLASAGLAAIASRLGRIPTVTEYHEAMGIVNKDAANVYKYMNFDQIEEYVENAKEATA